MSLLVRGTVSSLPSLIPLLLFSDAIASRASLSAAKGDTVCFFFLELFLVGGPAVVVVCRDSVRERFFEILGGILLQIIRTQTTLKRKSESSSRHAFVTLLHANSYYACAVFPSNYCHLCHCTFQSLDQSPINLV